MKLKFHFFAGLFLLIGALGNASNIIMIQGKLTSITDHYLIVETKDSQYYINKGLVNSYIAKDLNKTEVNVSLPVPMQALEIVKPKGK